MRTYDVSEYYNHNRTNRMKWYVHENLTTRICPLGLDTRKFICAKISRFTVYILYFQCFDTINSVLHQALTQTRLCEYYTYLSSVYRDEKQQVLATGSHLPMDGADIARDNFTLEPGATGRKDKTGKIRKVGCNLSIQFLRIYLY